MTMVTPRDIIECHSNNQIHCCKISAIPGSICAVFETALKSVHESVEGLAAQVVSVQEPLKAATGIETQEEDGEKGEH